MILDGPNGNLLREQCRIPDFVILGEMKCGTTSLWDMINQHEQVQMPHIKELHVLGSYSFHGAAGPRWVEDNMRRYQEFFTGIPKDVLTGEATPNYLIDPEVPQRLYSIAPNSRLIVVLRDPVKRAYSHYWHQVRRGREKLSFPQALAQEERRIEADRDAFVNFSYRTRGCYLTGLRRFEGLFGREKILVLFSNEVVKEPTEAMRRVTEHLGISPLIQCLVPPHKNKTRYGRSYALEVAKRFSMRAVGAMPEKARRMVLKVADVTRPLRTTESPHIPRKIERILRTFYRPHDIELAAWLQQPLPWQRA